MERHPGRAAPSHLAAAARLPAAQPGAQVRRGALAWHVLAWHGMFYMVQPGAGCTGGGHTHLKVRDPGKG